MSFASTNPTTLVTLNLFQGPSGSEFGASRMGVKPAGLSATPHSGCWDKWTLKQVQGDEQGGWMK